MEWGRSGGGGDVLKVIQTSIIGYQRKVYPETALQVGVDQKKRGLC